MPLCASIEITWLGGPSTTSTPTSQSTTTSDKKGGAREWIKNKLKALSSY